MNTSDWKAIGRVLEQPDAKILRQIVSAHSHDEAHALPHDISRDACRALRRLSSEVGSAAVAQAEVDRDEAQAGQTGLQSELRAMIEERDFLRGQIEFAEDCAQSRLIKLPKPQRKKGEHIATAHAIFTDAHAGLLVRPDAVLGLNEFNLKILQQRMGVFADRVVRLTKLHANHRKIQTLIIWGLGDWVNNELHGGDGSMSDVDGPMTAATWMAGAYAAMLLNIARDLDDIGIKVETHMLPGNHDRTTQKMESGRAYAVSYSSAIAFGVQALTDSKVTVRHPKATQVIVECPDGCRVRGVHGNQFRYNGGIGGPEVSIRRALPRLQKSIPFDLLIGGHLHSNLTPGDFLLSGSVCGVTPYSLDGNFEPREPEQLYFQTDSHYGLSTIHKIPLQ